MDIEIIAIGATTSVGSNAHLSAASVLAGLGRNRLHDLDSGVTCHVAVLPSENQDAPPGAPSRSRELLTRALKELAERLSAPASVHVFLSAPPGMSTEALLPPGTHVGALRCERVSRMDDDSGLAGLEPALAALRAGECELACLAGVDVRTDEATLTQLEQRGILITDESPWGFIPGEGAAAVLLATDRSRSASKLPRLATIQATATDMETAASRGEPCIGEALSRVCHKVLDTLSSEHVVGEVYSDLNGERSRASEWSYTLSRIGARCRDVMAVCTPAFLWGDVGHANGALLVQLATCQLSQGHTRGDHALVWTAGRAGARTAVLLSRLELESVPLQLPAAGSPTQADHDASVVDELLSEASFLFEQRARVVMERERAPENGLPKQERLEQRLERHVKALSLGGGLVFDRSAEMQDLGGATYVTARLALSAGAHERFLALLKASGTPEQQAELRSALIHAADAKHASLVEALLFSALPGAWALGLWLAAELCSVPSRPWRDLALAGGPRVLGDSFPHALARMGSASHAPLLEPWLLDEKASTRELAALAYLALDRASARERLMSLADPVFLPVLALSSDVGDQAALIHACELSRDAPSSALALGLLGTIDAVARLIDRLEEPALARAASCALYLATGVPLLEEQQQLIAASDDELTTLELQARAAGDESVGVERVRRQMFSFQVERWRAVHDQHRARFGAGERARLGQPLRAASSASVLLDPHLPPSVQRLCAFGVGRGSDRASWLPYDFRVLDQRRLAAAQPA